MPHGLAGVAASVATATARKPRWPATTAVCSATRSAHVVTGYEAFSTLAPEMIWEEMSEEEGSGEEGRSAQPTRKEE